MKYEEVYQLFPLRRQRKRERMGGGMKRKEKGGRKKREREGVRVEGRGKEGRRKQRGGG